MNFRQNEAPVFFSERKLSRNLKNKENIIKNVLIKKKKTQFSRKIYFLLVRIPRNHKVPNDRRVFIHSRYVSINSNY